MMEDDSHDYIPQYSKREIILGDYPGEPFESGEFSCWGQKRKPERLALAG